MGDKQKYVLLFYYIQIKQELLFMSLQIIYV